MFVKICGITTHDDALAAIDAGARALGFIFAPSPRQTTPALLEPWIATLPANIWKVGVFVDESPAAIDGITARLGLDIAQLHGAETPALHPSLPRIWKAFRVAASPAIIPDYEAEAIMLDGASFDWSHTAHLARPLILAGGLNPENVEAAIARVRRTRQPWAVDVASGVESTPGHKDHKRMKQFIDAALRA